MFDVGDRDLPVQTSGNSVIKGCITKWLRFFYVFNVFLKIQKNMTFYVFLRGCTRFVFSNTVAGGRCRQCSCCPAGWKARQRRPRQLGLRWRIVCANRGWSGARWETATLAEYNHPWILHSNVEASVCRSSTEYKQTGDCRARERLIRSDQIRLFEPPRSIHQHGITLLVVICLATTR